MAEYSHSPLQTMSRLLVGLFVERGFYMGLRRSSLISGWVLSLVVSVVFFQNCNGNFTIDAGSTNNGSTLAGGNIKVLVSWTPPTKRVDDSVLTDLAGFKIFYGTTPGSRTNSVDVGNVSSYEIKGLTSNTYYFSVVAYDSEGTQSDYSEEVVADARTL